MGHEHCYSKQFLAEQEIELYAGNKRILEWDTAHPNYKLLEFRTLIEKGIPLSETTDRKIINSYKEVQRLGFMIIARPSDFSEKSYRHQKVIYELIPRDPNIKDVGEIPMRTYPHWVEYSIENRKIRLVGMSAGTRTRFGRGPWISMPEKVDAKKRVVQQQTSSIYMYMDKKKVANKLNIFMKNLAPVEEAPQFLEVDELAFMITQNNELVCFDDGADPPVVAAVGTRGSGKTMVTHTLVDEIYNKNKGRIFALNDRQRQFLTWPLPSTSEGLNRENQKVMHYPTPLPCVFLYPTDFNLREIDFEDEGIGFEMTLPYEAVIDNYKYFFQGRKNWELGGSERYFKYLRPVLRSCKTIEEVREKLKDEFKDKKGLKGTWEKILKTMEDLFDMRILDINTSIPSKWGIKYQGRRIGDYFPISAALSVGLIPIVENGHIYNKDYYPQYMRWLIQDVYENLLTKRLPYDERTWMIIDEIGQIYKKNKARTVAAEALIDAFTEGRKPNLASIYTLQSWAKIDEEIQLNTTDVIAFNTNQSTDVAELGSAFSLDKEEKRDLANLNTFECLAMTKTRFVMYDMDGNRYHTDEPVKGRILFPTSQHSKVGQ